MSVTASDGTVLADFESSETADYSVSLTASESQYPLLIDAIGGIDLVTGQAPDFMVKGIVLEAADQAVSNVNPFSTIAVEMATDMSGGLTAANIQSAEGIAVTQLNFGLDQLAATGVMTTPIDDSNIAEIVRASEALGELIRRTSSRISAGGNAVSGDEVLRAIASDLADDVLDGRGGSRADARIAAVANVVAAQVALETMANTLHVGGVDGTAAMETAINQVSIDGSPQSLSDLDATIALLWQAQIGLAAALNATGDALLEDLATTVLGMQANLGPDQAASQLPSDYRQRINAALDQIMATGSAAFESVNAIARSGDLDPGTNSAPVISGIPPASVTHGQTYEFTPNVSDPDGDALTLRVYNLPNWLSFDASTGRISGTPSPNDANTYTGITITASDSAETSVLGPFSIAVQAIGSGSVTLNWAAPTQNTDGSALTNLAGYRIYWGQNGSYPNSVSIDNPGLTTATIDNLPSGTWDFVSTAINNQGVESEYSNVSTHTVP